MVQKSLNSFEAVAREWLEKTQTRMGGNHRRRGRTAFKSTRSLQLGHGLSPSITPPEMLAVLRVIELMGHSGNDADA